MRACDFGLSQSVRAAISGGCSPLYAAPELHQLRAPSTAADTWSAGVMLYQALTGAVPFWPGKSLREVAQLPRYELLAGVRTHPIAFAPSVRAELSAAAVDLCERMLDRNSSTRISAADALAHPWMEQALGYAPAPSIRRHGMSNIVVAGRRGSAAEADGAGDGGALLIPRGGVVLP